jgi:hypothetical protein
MARAVTAIDVPTPLDDQYLQEPPVDPQGGAVLLLRAIALQRPLLDLLQLMALLDQDEQSTHATEILATAATMRPVGDVAALFPLLAEPLASNVLHAAATGRPVEELAQLVRHLHNPPTTLAPVDTAEPAPAPQQPRWKLNR